jgi:GH15 family glucan-1,4-alpha-glucosidase
MSNLIEEYGLIGDGETAALIHRNGSVDWLCLPRFDSDACFAALLGTAENGCWKLAPVEPSHASRSYLDDTLVLQTEFETHAGAVRVMDFMPIRQKNPALIRMVQGLRGCVKIRSEMRLCFDYGSVQPWLEVQGTRALARVGPDLAVLYAPADFRCAGSTLVCDLEVHENDVCAFLLIYGSSSEPVPPPFDPAGALSKVQEYWREWIGHFDKPTEWPAAVRRSLITLKAMIHRASGGIIAAPTTSLPERSGRDFNWDYRFCWIRDASFTLMALIDTGYACEAKEWRDWLLRAVAGEPEKMRIAYRVDGSRRLEEWEANWLPGYHWTPPVRIGNSAASQRQLDIFGELMDSISIAAKAGIERSAQEERLIDGISQHVEAAWRKPDHGLWELRGEPRHYVYSKVSAWVAIDRYVRHLEDGGSHQDAKLRRMSRLRRKMHDEICREGYDPGLGSFVEYYGAESVDASLLLLPLVGFLPVDDERISRTIDAIERELMVDGLIHRRHPQHQVQQGAFLACNCWLAECRLMQGRREAARKDFERVLAVANDLGLLAEEYDVRAKRLAGNFPQALSHVALVRTALRFSAQSTERGAGR